MAHDNPEDVEQRVTTLMLLADRLLEVGMKDVFALRKLESLEDVIDELSRNTRLRDAVAALNNDALKQLMQLEMDIPDPFVLELLYGHADVDREAFAVGKSQDRDVVMGLVRLLAVKIIALYRGIALAVKDSPAEMALQMAKELLQADAHYAHDMMGNAPTPQQPPPTLGVRELDLHGMTLQEALAAVTSELNDRTKRTLHIITGRGIHSANGPVIKPKVEELLQQRGLAYTTPANNDGKLVVVL